MPVVLDRETVEKFRRLSPREAFEEAKNAVYRSGANSSDDFLEMYEALVEQGVLSWDQIEAFDR